MNLSDFNFNLERAFAAGLISVQKTSATTADILLTREAFFKLFNEYEKSVFEQYTICKHVVGDITYKCVI